jgi:anti-sigma factor RsiW
MAMNCEHVRERMLEALEGAVPADLQAHMESCAGCAARLAELRRTMAVLDEWKAPEVSPYFDSRLQARLREEQQTASRGWFAWLGLKPAAAALAVLLVVGVSLLNIGQQPGDVGYNPPPQNVVVASDSAVSDLETLDANEELLADFELLDQIGNEPQNGS